MSRRHAGARRILDGVRDVEHAMRQVLCELELTSTASARTCVPVVTSSPPESSPPCGTASPAEHWRNTYNDARTERERANTLHGARAELSHIRRRRFAVGTTHDGDALRRRVIDEGEGSSADVVALALKCTPTFVRRARVAAGRDAEHGRTLKIGLDAHALRNAGMSLRAIALVVGTPRSTLHDQLSAVNR